MSFCGLWVSVLTAASPGMADGLPDAPLLQAEEVPLPASADPSASGLMLQRRFDDPYRGSWRMGEVGAGAGGVLVADVLSLGIGFGAALALCEGSCGSGDGSALGAIIVTALISVAVDIALTPLFATVFAHWWSSPEAAGSLGKSFLYSFAAKGLELVSLVVAIAVPVLAPLCGSIALALHFIGVPMAASMGLHSISSDESPALAATRGVPVLAW
jgi:hypothetical protein